MSPHQALPIGRSWDRMHHRAPPLVEGIGGVVIGRGGVETRTDLEEQHLHFFISTITITKKARIQLLLAPSLPPLPSLSPPLPPLFTHLDSRFLVGLMLNCPSLLVRSRTRSDTSLRILELRKFLLHHCASLFLEASYLCLCFISAQH